MVMTRTIPCKAKADPSLAEGTRLASFSNKRQAADSSSVQVVVGREASHSISQVAAIESKSCPFDTVTSAFAIPALLLTVCLEMFVPFSPSNEARSTVY
jgi:hypothetical protein